MNPDKKQRQQLVVLGLLVVGFVGFLSFQATRGKAPAPPAPAAKTTETAATTQTTEEEPGVLTASATGTFPELGQALSRRDPFLPQRLPSNEENPQAQTVQPQVRRVSMPFSTSRVPAVSLPPINPFGSGNASVRVTPDLTTSVEPEPEFVLTGVIRGARNVAILRSNTGGRHIVKQGQMIEGHYRVLTVNFDGVVLAHNNRRIYVKLGGVKNAS